MSLFAAEPELDPLALGSSVPESPHAASVSAATDMTAATFGSRFHGHDERIDVESLALATQFWIDIATDLLT